jgi:hypothetical protein
LLQDPTLSLVEAPVLAPQDLIIDPNQIQAMQDELVEAENAPIEDGDEDI